MHYDNDCKGHNQNAKRNMLGMVCKFVSYYYLQCYYLLLFIEIEDLTMTLFQRTTEDFKPEDHELFLNAGRTCIAQGDSSELLDFIKEEANQVNLEALT